MPITFLNVALLTGLLAVVIPPLIHLLNRRRFAVVRWGAMQFLDVSQRTRRRVFLEEVLLMVVRIALIALLVVGLAAPVDASRWLDFLADRGTRDVVLVIDGSASMGYRGPTGTAHDAAKTWVMSFLDDLGPADGVAVVHARHRPTAVVAAPTHDFDAVRTAVQTLRPPRGGCDGPAAVRAAVQALSKSTAARREVVVLTDGQRQGWAHDAAVPGWDALGGDESPRVWVVNLAPNRPPDPPNRSVAPLRASRAIASVGQHVSFQTALVRHGAGDPPPDGRLRLLVDGQAVGDLPPPTGPGKKGRSPTTVRHRFAAAGSHVVTVQAQPDALPADDRADFALEVLPQLPVLLVDGDPDPAATRRGADFLRDALSPARDPQPAIRVRVLPIGEFEPSSLTRDLAGPGTAPRVVVLCNVARLTPEQEAAVAAFLEAGGGVLVAPGDRVDAGHYTRDLHRGGRGWLPAAVGDAVGDPGNPTGAAQPQLSSFFHPSLELFREPQPGGLGDARFPHYWKLTMPPGGRAVAVARLTTGDPLLAEAAVGAGRVLQACVPMDNSWGTNLVELPAFAPLCHELVYYLAGARSAALNLSPGQPIRYRVPQDAPTVGWSIKPPDGRERAAAVNDSQIVSGETDEAGTYEVRHAASNAVQYYVVQSDPAESDLAAWTDADRERVRQLVPGVVFAENRDTIVSGILQAPRPAELWWVCLVGVVALLTAEVLLTRRRALAAGA